MYLLKAYRTGMFFSVIGMVLLAVACGDSEIETYEVPKGSESIQDGVERSAESRSPEAGGSEGEPDAKWVVPSGWRVDETPRPMRLKTFMIDTEGAESVEVAVTLFPGEVGGLLANVNRWRGQIGLASVDEGELEGLTERFTSPGFQGHLLHLRGPEVEMLAASIYELGADRTWFVRVVGEGSEVEAVKGEVFDFARSFGTSASSSPDS